jgi:hypothetical protein
VSGTRYPLQWPDGWPRTPQHLRRFHHFSTGSRGRLAFTVADAVQRLRNEVRKLAGPVASTELVVSTNIPVKRDGMPYSGYKAPEDRGVAVYFVAAGKPRVLACDRYTDIAGNIAAVAAHIEAMRAMERHGVGTLEQAFAGYTALPPRVEDAIDWRSALRLGADATLAQAEAQYRTMAREHHADAGGTHEAMVKLNAAIAAARKELS